ncbi:caspase domain-containing protein [Mycotypha africana]|uniref:caspase domain-containing protein n=1 Tax=Mycotypha africana TaxID=64632 RepID=UPI002301BCB0|nr:caspase domain-containing protein [Mycotypha africana]KAI8982005.1 caspase domain-containing protein [Mycotypha africana]
MQAVKNSFMVLVSIMCMLVISAEREQQMSLLVQRQRKFQLSSCRGRKKAVLIGINYIGSDSELRGCINDAQSMRALLTTQFNFSEDNMLVLTDDQPVDGQLYPTKKNMIAAMKWLVQDSQPNDSLFFHYSGHGGSVKDSNGDEIDGYDETIFPVDFRNYEAGTGQLVDDELHELLVKPLVEGCRLTCVFDSCHSGTVLDLPYVYSTFGTLQSGVRHEASKKASLTASSSFINRKLARYSSLGSEGSSHKEQNAFVDQKETNEQRLFSPADVILFAGCRDDQTSADAQMAGQAAGAMSYAFIKTLKANPEQSYMSLLNNVRNILKNEFSQRPQMSTSHPIDPNSKKTPAELLRQHQRAITKAQRELDREREKLERQEKKLILDIKKAAKANQMGACKVMAKDLVRTRRNVQKFYQMKTQLQAIGLRIQTLRSSQQMAEAMRGATKAMGSMNRQMNLPQIQKIMMDFERESELMDMKDEMMGDAIDDAFEEDEDEEESDEIVNKVLDEIGISLNQEVKNSNKKLKSELGEVPTGLKHSEPVTVSSTEKVAQTEGLSADDAALQARLDNLRRE